MYVSVIKPLCDRCFALLLLVVLSPALFLLYLFLGLTLRENPVFVQSRGGYRNRVFKVIKFKTMCTRCDDQGNLLPDSQRLTRLGNMVRKASLDELPQLVNVLKGEMSFVGPRPFLAEYLEIYAAEERRRHDVRPGMTGWAQVAGRNALTWKQKFQYDLWYVDNVSFALDLRILLLTIKKVLRREGVNQSSDSTMEKYNGQN